LTLVLLSDNYSTEEKSESVRCWAVWYMVRMVAVITKSVMTKGVSRKTLLPYRKVWLAHRKYYLKIAKQKWSNGHQREPALQGSCFVKIQTSRYV
jgi:hypothetical protein